MWYKGGYASWQRRVLSRMTHHERHLRLTMNVTYDSKICIHGLTAFKRSQIIRRVRMLPIQQTRQCEILRTLPI